MITAHPMVKGSFASNPTSVRVYKKNPQQQYNGSRAASEHILEKKHAALGSARLAVALHKAFINRASDDQIQQHQDCIDIHEATIDRLTRRVR